LFSKQPETICSHKNSALALIHCIEIPAVTRVPSGTNIFSTQKSNGSLKYDFLNVFKNLEEVYERETNDNSAREIDG
jgi:hypothetical protein